MKGKLIVLEGIDGCGKTTQINHLSKWLPNSGLMPRSTKLHITREPGGTPLGVSLRELLLHPPGNQLPTKLTELLLYTADRAQHLSEVIKPLINQGDWVISDRLSGSTLAYQGYGRGLNHDIINLLEDIALQDFNPDLTFWLDVSIKKSLERRGGKCEDRIEAEGAEFLKKVSSGFSKIATERGWIHISADLKSSLVSQQIEKELKTFLCNDVA
tara:strand:+ start:256 stop:897 length:642 start_codon:yes stop_codon:yes gene_type:complete